MAKKALKRASWRTIARRAEKAPAPQAARLRKRAAAARRTERAAKKGGNRTVKSLAREAHKAGLAVQITSIPRSARAAKGWETRRANELAKAKAAGGLTGLVAGAPETQEGINRSPSAAWPSSQAPGHGEIVGGQDARIAENIVAMSRKKGGVDKVQEEVSHLIRMAEISGRQEGQKFAQQRVLELHQSMSDSIVCGFIACVDHMQRNGIPPGHVFVIGGHEALRIVDALNKAGYKATGKAGHNMATG